MVSLVFAGRHTEAYRFLVETATPEGVAPTPPRFKGRIPSNGTRFHKLFKQGLVEVRNSGPRGGLRYHATPAGIAAIKWFKYPPTQPSQRHSIT